MEWPGIESDTRARCSRVKGRLKIGEEREDSLEGGCRDGERAIGDVADMWALHGRLAEMSVLVVKGEERREGRARRQLEPDALASACLRVSPGRQRERERLAARPPQPPRLHSSRHGNQGKERESP